MTEPETFTYDGGAVEPGETQDLRFTVTETYLGDPVRIPVTVVNGAEPGPTAYLSAAVHGDELNGVEVVRSVAQDWDHSNLCGTLVCMPVLNVPAFIAQQRYLPVYDRDLNRSFPGDSGGNSASRIANEIFRNFVEPCDFGVDYHTSTRGRTNMLHVRADMDHEIGVRVARSFASHVVIDTEGPSGTLRREATEVGTPTVTVEMGRAHRFQREFVDQALEGTASVLAEFDMYEDAAVSWPGWRTEVEGGDEKTWVRSDAGGLVEMHSGYGELVHEDEVIATITNPFKTETSTVTAPFTGLLVGVIENPLVYPGNPICHLVHLDEKTQKVMERTDESPV